MWTLQPAFIAWRHLSVGYQQKVYINPSGRRVSVTPNPPDSELAILQLSEADANRLKGRQRGSYLV